MNRLILNYHTAAFFYLLTFAVSSFATTYPQYSTEELQLLSDANVIGEVISIHKIINEQGRLCNLIGEVKVHHSFKSLVTRGDVITINLYDGMEIGAHFLLYLISSDDSVDLSSSRYYSEGDYEWEEKCKKTKKPDYTIVMDGIGSQDIVLPNSSSLIDGFIEFHSFWIKPHESLLDEVTGEDWDEITKVKVSDFIQYSNSINPIVNEKK